MLLHSMYSSATYMRWAMHDVLLIVFDAMCTCVWACGVLDFVQGVSFLAPTHCMSMCGCVIWLVVVLACMPITW